MKQLFMVIQNVVEHKCAVNSLLYVSLTNLKIIRNYCYIIMNSDMNSDKSSTPDRPAQLRAVQNEAYELFKKKNADYGDAFSTYGPIGVVVRMGDKINRLVSIDKTKVSFVNDESLRDTLIDLHNYSAMCVMLLDEKK